MKKSKFIWSLTVAENQVFYKSTDSTGFFFIEKILVVLEGKHCFFALKFSKKLKK